MIAHNAISYSDKNETPGGGQKKDAFKRWQKTRQDTSLKAEYKKACKETKSVIAKAKHDATKHLYDELDTKE